MKASKRFFDQLGGHFPTVPRFSQIAAHGLQGGGIFTPDKQRVTQGLQVLTQGFDAGRTAQRIIAQCIEQLTELRLAQTRIKPARFAQQCA